MKITIEVPDKIIALARKHKVLAEEFAQALCVVACNVGIKKVVFTGTEEPGKAAEAGPQFAVSDRVRLSRAFVCPKNASVKPLLKHARLYYVQDIRLNNDGTQSLCLVGIRSTDRDHDAWLRSKYFVKVERTTQRKGDT